MCINFHHPMGWKLASQENLKALSIIPGHGDELIFWERLFPVAKASSTDFSHVPKCFFQEALIKFVLVLLSRRQSSLCASVYRCK